MHAEVIRSSPCKGFFREERKQIGVITDTRINKQMSLGEMKIQNDKNQVGQRIVHLIEHHDLNTHARLQVLFEEMVYIDCPTRSSNIKI